jgi:hypothetical protein
MSIISSSKLLHHTFRPWSVEDRFIVVDPEWWQRPFDWNKAAEASAGASVFCLASVDVFEQGDRPLVNAKGERPTICASGCPHPTRKDGTPKHAAYSKCPRCSGETRPLTLDDVREQLFDLIRRTPHLQWLLPTKRIESVMSCLPKDWGTEGWGNVWIGTIVENPLVRFLSYEPALRPIDFNKSVDAVAGRPPDFEIELDGN